MNESYTEMIRPPTPPKQTSGCYVWQGLEVEEQEALSVNTSI